MNTTEVYELLEDKLKDKNEIEEEEFYKLVGDTSPLLCESTYRFLMAIDSLYAHGWTREERVEDGMKKIYYKRNNTTS